MLRHPRFSNPDQKVFALMRQSGAEYRKGSYENNPRKAQGTLAMGAEYRKGYYGSRCRY
jgi:hypothetical protein